MTSVVIFVFDGLQPAQVNPRLMPNLSAFAARGVTFANHHSVFPTVTRVNASSMVTGQDSGGHGLAGNTLLVRDFDPVRAISAMEPQLAEVAKSTGRVLLAPTLAEILAEHGQEYVAIGVGTSGNAYLHNPTAELTGGATIHPNFALPADLHDYLTGRFGPWPEESVPNTARLVHAARIFIEYVLTERQPAVTLLWSSEPDKSQHAFGVGSGQADDAIREADAQFGRLIGWLRSSGRINDTDVIVVSDHGYSTISEAFDLEAAVREAGFPSGGEPGGVVVANNGGAALLYAGPGTAGRLAAWLMRQPWCGTVTASDTVHGITGTLPASLVGNQGPRAPELTVSFRWDSALNSAGYAGTAHAARGRVGTGQHGSMSRHEIASILFASGPSFKSELELDTPSGNFDLAPTILRILGISGDWNMQGRTLEESLAGGPSASALDWTTGVHQAERALGDGVYRQEIKISTVGQTNYVDEGNRIQAR